MSQNPPDDEPTATYLPGGAPSDQNSDPPVTLGKSGSPSGTTGPAPHYDTRAYEQNPPPHYGQAPGYNEPQYGAPQYGQPPYGQQPGYDPQSGYGQQYPPQPGYGQQQPAYGGYPQGAYAPPPGTNTMAILALIFAFIVAPLGVVFGFIGRGQIKRTGENGDGLALAGIIIGGVFTLLIVAYIVFVVVLFGALASQIPDFPTS
jgi:hypothetical protein